MDTKKFKKSWRYLWKSANGFRIRIALSCLTGVLAMCVSLLFIFLSKQTIDVATGKIDGDMTDCIVGMLCVMLLQLLCSAIDTWVTTKLQVDSVNIMRSRIFARLMKSRWGKMEKFHSGDVVNRIEKDVATLTGMLTGVVPSMVIMGLQLLVAMWLFCLLDTRLPWIVVGIMILLLPGVRKYWKKMANHSRKLRLKDSMVQAIIQEGVQLRFVVKALEMDKTLIGKLDDIQESLKGRWMARTRFSIWAHLGVSVVFSTGYFAAFIWGVLGLYDGSVSFGTMAAFLQLVAKVQQPVWNIAQLIPSFVEGITSMRRLRELDMLPMEKEETNLIMKDIPEIVIDDIDFVYAKGDEPVFRNFSCKFPAGSRTALMGKTGIGKTTLIRLMLAFDVPQKGNIWLRTQYGNVKVSDRTRCNFAYVPQGNTLFSGTIADNLLMGNPDASRSDMYKVLQMAEAGFVFELPNGMDTFIGEKGSELSEGQAQRIVIARALLKDASVFLMDEATSALDDGTEKKLMDNLELNYKEKTFIFVTHHAAVAARCEQVIEL